MHPQNYLHIIFVAILCNFQSSQSLPSLALPVPLPASFNANAIETKQDFLESVYADCTDNKSSVPCFKQKLFAFVDRILNKDEINLTNGVTVVKSASSTVDGAPRSLDETSETDLKNADIGTTFINRVQRFLSTHTLKVDLKGIDVLNAVSRAGRTIEEMSERYEETEDDDEDDDGEVEAARKKNGKKKKGGGKKGMKMMGHMLMMMKMKLLGLIPFLFGLIALMAGKALLFGKIALLISLILLAKKLFMHHPKTISYEVLGHPHSSGGHDSYSSGSGSDYSNYSSGGSGGAGHSGWGRSSDAHSMAYKAYDPSDVKSG